MKGGVFERKKPLFQKRGRIELKEHRTSEDLLTAGQGAGLENLSQRER